jgi:hypothetical protein
MRIHVDKVGSITRNLGLGRWATLTDTVAAGEGAVVAGRIIGEKSVYNQLEDVHGRLVTLHHGDVIVGALGHRNALQGYEGVLPRAVSPGDRLHVLNMGGVLGQCISANPGVGDPFEVEVLGQVLRFPQFGSREGQPAFIQDGALQGRPGAGPVPAIFVAGTCMNAGKTLAACALVRSFHQAGFKVGGAKLTGVSLMRDVLAMRDYGAEAILDFTDAGVACTGPATAPGAARVIFTELASRGVDLIVAETGDGILGEYGVQAVFSDPELMAWAAATVLCANDPVGVEGGIRALKERFQVDVDVVAGPATDNRVGVRFVESLGRPAFNARTHGRELGDLLLAKVEGRLQVNP